MLGIFAEIRVTAGNQGGVLSVTVYALMIDEIAKGLNENTDEPLINALKI